MATNTSHPKKTVKNKYLAEQLELKGFSSISEASRELKFDLSKLSRYADNKGGQISGLQELACAFGADPIEFITGYIKALSPESAQVKS